MWWKFKKKIQRNKSKNLEDIHSPKAYFTWVWLKDVGDDDNDNGDG